MTELKSGEQ